MANKRVHYSVSCEEVWVKFFWRIGCESGTKWVDFGGDLDHDLVYS